MTIEEAKQSIGKPFKWNLVHFWDTIKEVDEASEMIKGEFIIAPAEDCRLKQEQPEQFKKQRVLLED